MIVNGATGQPMPQAPRPQSTEDRRALRRVTVEIWNRWAPDALESPLAPAELIHAYNRWQPDHLKIRTPR